ncbi:MAG: diaminopimelate epimerase [Micromonosporaceae bacterium]|nr:diaminopimelate epimerase [Micromonosporaceae bacterium]
MRTPDLAHPPRARFAKGHATGNDFVLLPDPDGELVLTPELVRAICDRRFGIGGDGVLRVVRAAKHPEGARYAGQAEWFMDYHNADGSLAEMCGNGVRVYARYLAESGLATGPAFALATRSGVVSVRIPADAGEDGLISVDLTRPVVGPASAARFAGRTYPGTSCSVGNPHLVCPVPDVSTVDLSGPPELDPAVFPESANVELVTPVEGPEPRVRMRVYERGSGETLSCGSGACAAAAVLLQQAGQGDGRVVIDVPGGQLRLRLEGERCELTGPAVIVADGELRLSAE